MTTTTTTTDDADADAATTTTTTGSSSGGILDSHHIRRDRRILDYYDTYQYIPPVPDYSGGIDRISLLLSSSPGDDGDDDNDKDNDHSNNNQHESLIFFPYQDSPKECGLGPTFDNFFMQDKNKRSRLDEDKILYENLFYSGDEKNHRQGQQQGQQKLNGKKRTRTRRGRFVELGGFDGTTESNTRFFEYCLGWEGLIIEGNPMNYQKTIVNRPGAHKMSFAPSCLDDGDGTVGGDVTVGGDIIDGVAAKNRTYIDFYVFPLSNSGVRGSANAYEGKQTVPVPCGPLAPVLSDVFLPRVEEDDGRSRIDFFSLDVEGAEMMVLKTIDFKTGPIIEVLMIEVENSYCPQRGYCEVREQVRSKMHSEGYKRYERIVQASDIYIHPQSRYQFTDSFATQAR